MVCGTRTKCIISLNVQASTCTHIIFLFVIYKNETKRTYVKDISITKTDWFDMLWEIYKLFIEIFFFGLYVVKIWIRITLNETHSIGWFVLNLCYMKCRPRFPFNRRIYK